MHRKIKEFGIKLETCIAGTYEENAKNRVEGHGWFYIPTLAICLSTPALVHMVEKYHSTALGYAVAAVVAEGIVRGLRSNSHFISTRVKSNSELELEKRLVAKPGIIGSIRELYNIT